MSIATASLLVPSPVGLVRLHEVAPAQRPELAAHAVWTELVQGRMRIVSHGVSEKQVWLKAMACSPREARPRDRERAWMLEAVLAGQSQKVLAIELDVAPSTVSAGAAEALRAMGLSCCVRSAPLAIVMLATVHALGGAAPPGYVVESDGSGGFEVRMDRPEPVLKSALSAAEYATLRAATSGLSHERVGLARGRSRRTVANQLRSVAGKLGVSGRFALINLAVVLSSGDRGPSERPFSKVALLHG